MGMMGGWGDGGWGVEGEGRVERGEGRGERGDGGWCEGFREEGCAD